MTRILHKTKNESGSATVEAVVAFMGFLLTIFTILNIVNFCRTQALISNAIDTTAKEMSQYGYFYKMSGLQKFSEDMKNVSDVGKSKVNEVIGSVDDLYTSLTGAVDSSVSRGTEISNAINDGSILDMDKIQSVIDGVSSDGANVKSSIDLVSANINNIISNPISYIKCLASVAANGALDAAKSRVIAVPLAKAFFVKHFGDSAEDASKKLENLGVIGGLAGMNFNDSTMFCSDSPNDIHVVVSYKLQLIQLFKMAELTATIKKEALAGGWLGGDDVIVKIKEVTTTAPAEDADKSDDPTDEETTDETPTEEATKVDTEGSYWYLTVDEHNYDNKLAAFANEMVDATGISVDTGGIHMYGRDNKNNAYGVQYCVDAKDAKHIGSRIADGWGLIKAMETSKNGEDPKYEPGSTKSYTCFVYVPENISDSELAKVQSTINEELKTYLPIVEKEYGTCNIPLGVKVVKGGGNYDYGG